MTALASLVMQRRLYAVLVAGAFAMLALLFPPLSVLSAAVVALVTLREGAWPGLTVAGLASLICGALALLLYANPVPLLGFVVVLWLPVWGLGLVLRSSRSLDVTVQGAMLVGLLIALTYASQVTAEHWQEILEPITQALRQSGVVDEQQAGVFVAALALWMPGLLAAGFFVQLVLALFIGRWWQAKLYNPGGFRTEFHGLRLHRAVAVLALPLLAMALLETEGGWQAIRYLGPLLLVAYFFQGLAVAHSVVAKTGMHRSWLYGLYVLLLLAMGYTVMALAALGYTDAWLDFRARLSRAGRNSD
jgi:hypothetical protein